MTFVVLNTFWFSGYPKNTLNRQFIMFTHKTWAEHLWPKIAGFIENKGLNIEYFDDSILFIKYHAIKRALGPQRNLGEEISNKNRVCFRGQGLAFCHLGRRWNEKFVEIIEVKRKAVTGRNNGHCTDSQVPCYYQARIPCWKFKHEWLIGWFGDGWISWLTMLICFH